MLVVWPREFYFQNIVREALFQILNVILRGWKAHVTSSLECVSYISSQITFLLRLRWI